MTPPAKDRTERVDVLEERFNGFCELMGQRLAGLEAALKENSSDTRATKRLLVGILVSIVLAFCGAKITGCGL